MSPQPDTAAAEPPPRLLPFPNSAVFRLPDADDFAEQYLFHANEADRAFSKQQVCRLLPDFTGTNPTGVQRVDVPRLQRLFDLDLLDRLLDHGADPGRLTISNWQFLGDVTNAALPGNERAHGAIAGRAASEGGRVALNGIERSTPGLRRLAEHIGRLWQARVIITASVGTGAFSGQNNVVLAYDHIVIPIVGLRHVVATLPDGSTLHAGPIGPGEALHVPAGASISTSAVNELFVHLELRIERPLPRSVLPMVADLPLTQQVAWPEDGSSLQDSLVARWCAMLPARPGTRFSSMVGPPAGGKYSAGSVRSTLTGGWCPLVGDEHDSGPTLVVAAAGICVSLPESLLEVLADLLSGPPRRVSEIIAVSSPAERLIDLLVASGLLEFFPSEHSDDSWDAIDVQEEDNGAL